MARTIRNTDYTGYGSKDDKTDRVKARRLNRKDVNRALALMARDLGLADAIALPIDRGTEGHLTH